MLSEETSITIRIISTCHSKSFKNFSDDEVSLLSDESLKRTEMGIV